MIISPSLAYLFKWMEQCKIGRGGDEKGRSRQPRTILLYHNLVNQTQSEHNKQYTENRRVMHDGLCQRIKNNRRKIQKITSSSERQTVTSHNS